MDAREAKKWLVEHHDNLAFTYRWHPVDSARWDELAALLADFAAAHSAQVEAELRQLGDEVNGINPRCGHEWKFTDRKGDEFESCTKCDLGAAEAELVKLRAAMRLLDVAITAGQTCPVCGFGVVHAMSCKVSEFITAERLKSYEALGETVPEEK
jgi:hypothetical protein